MFRSPPPTAGGGKKKASGREGSRTQTCIYIICAAVVGSAIGLIGLNVYQANSCDSAAKKTDQELFIEAINYRLQAAEYENARNTAKMNSLIDTMRKRLGPIDQAEMDALISESEDEAVRVSLLLAAQPAPPRPYVYTDTSISGSSQVVDDQKGSGIWGEEEEGPTGANEFIDDWKSLGSGAGAGAVSKQEKPISDAEATEFCLSWKTQYEVIPGVSWGTLPSNLQQKWMLYSCDYHLQDSVGNSGFASPQEHAESHEQAREDHQADGGEGGNVEKELEFLADDILGKYKDTEKGIAI